MSVHIHPMQFSKAGFSDPASRMEKLLDLWSPRLAKAFRDAVANVKKEMTEEILDQMIDRGDLTKFEALIVRAADKFSTFWAAAFIASGNATASTIAAGSGTEALFDVSDLTVINRLRIAKMEFMRAFLNEQRQIAISVITVGSTIRSNREQQASALIDAVGLTERQNDTIDNYRRLLEQGSREALSRELRDRRFDSTLERSIDGDIALTPEQIENQVAAYRRKFINHRAKVIGDTQAGMALNEGRFNSFNQSIASGDLQEEQITRIWRTNIDGRERNTHNYLNGKKVTGMKEKYISSSGAQLLHPHDPSAPIDEIIGCRCGEEYVIKDISDE